MKIPIFLKALLFSILFFSGRSVYSQDSKIVAEIHDLLTDNLSKEKVIQIRFLNCTKNDFENLYKVASKNTNLQAFRQAYSADNSIGSIHFSKSSEITTSDLKKLLGDLNVSNVIFNEKKISVSDLQKYQLLNREKLQQNERIEK